MCRLLSLILAVLAYPLSAHDFEPLSNYRSLDVQEFNVLLHPSLEAEYADELRRGLELIERGLTGVKEAVPTKALSKLRGTKIVVEWEQRTGGGAACYHKSREWLQANGYDPEKAGCVEISNLRDFIAAASADQPMVILHELAHAYHNRVLGLDFGPVKDAYEAAEKSGSYSDVLRAGGWRGKAYAMNNREEYFAELTEAYFGRNDFFPFTAGQLRAYDPAGFAAVERAWSENL